jgi:hypothetical protein
MTREIARLKKLKTESLKNGDLEFGI